jgi:long-subunit acyl-CoA synthetase (AMP-forming)
VPGDRVALFAENRVEWQVIRVALARAGAIVVPVSTHFRSEELRYALAQSRARMVFLTESFRSNAFLEYLRRVESDLPDLEQIVIIGSQPALPGLATLEDMLAVGRSSTAALPDRARDRCVRDHLHVRDDRPSQGRGVDPRGRHGQRPRGVQAARGHRRGGRHRHHPDVP